MSMTSNSESSNLNNLDNLNNLANTPEWLVDLEETEMEVVTGGILFAGWYQRWLNNSKSGRLDFFRAQRLVGRLLNEEAAGNTPTNNAIGFNWWSTLSPNDQFQWNVGVVQAINANVPPTVNYGFRPFG